MPPRVQAVLPGVLLAALAAVVALTRELGLDYQWRPGDNNAGPTLDALARGEFATAAGVQPAMGAWSILVRLPLVAVAGGDLLAQWRAGVLACLLFAVALAIAVDRRLAAGGAPLLRRFVTGLLFVAGPPVLAALAKGHPEDVLAGALAAGAVLAALAQRQLAAAVLVGLAVGTKQPALVAGVPVLLALRGGWVRVTLVAALTAALCTLPGLLADPDRFRQVAESLGDTARVYPPTLWWPLAGRTELVRDYGGGELIEVSLYAMPLGLDRSHAGVLQVLVAGLLLAALWRLRRRVDPLGVLVALLVLRGALDPMNLDYYFAPAWLALLAWEARARPQASLPLVALASGLAWWLIWSWEAPGRFSDLGWFALWAAGTLPLLALAWPRRGGAQPAAGEPPSPAAHQRPVSISS